MTTKTLTSLRSQNKKTIRVISSLVIALGMVFSIMPFVRLTVNAEDPTYITTDSAMEYMRDNSNNPVYIETIGDDVRFCILLSNNGTGYALAVMSSSSGCAYRTGTDLSNATWRYMNHSMVYDGVTYYTYQTSSFSAYTLSNQTFSIPVNRVSSGTYNGFNNGYRFLFGDLSVEPEPVTSYGNIKDLSYTTKISGLSGDQNHDVISWYPYWDTNNNISTTWNMEIRVVPGTYTSDTQNGLFALDPTNFVINLGVSSYVYQGAYTKGEIEVSWLRIKELLSPWQLSIDGLFSFFDGDYWTKKGWMYQARYIDPENNYTSEWQNIYTITSSSGKGVEDILDPTDGHGLPDFYQNVQDSYNQVFNTTSNVNNTYNNVYYVNNTPYLINPSVEEDPITADELNEIINNALRKLLQMQGDQITIINEGDSNTQTIINNNYNVVQELADQDQQLHDYEYQFNSDLETNLDNIDTSPAVLTNNGFLNAANWVRAQYDRVTLNTPFELIIVFALVLGLGLVIIGKLR